MVFGAIYAPSVASFESLFEYFQSSLSYVVPTIVVVYIAGLFVPWLNGNGAFWTIVAGLVVGVPLFILKEVTSMWTDFGLPEIHYTIMSSIMMVIGIGIHFGLSAVTRQSKKERIEELVWSGDEAKEIFTTLERPIWRDRTLWSALLASCMVGFIIWIW
ncbi:solute:Na+ symporter, SSS family [Citreimonas salinaria]|uniref:Solute:Na+ symporter, SSS family n=2 Tax=Citreimonas salinaria TaxID=321339 RepID=A0A1H3J457_9RHOB|nr:solute:Na+ symporter, SSS family [Citreimonas salinaria]